LHKIFAKTLFLGKSVVYLPHCHSTNDVARAFDKSDKLKEGTVVMADYQEKGKGQLGNVWVSEAGKNLLFTLVLKPKEWPAGKQFYLNALISTALLRAIRTYLPNENLEIKWPNDIYVNDRKIAGILIETTINGTNLESVLCGIGLNVNQSHFTLPNATSLQMESGQTYDRDGILETILLEMEKDYPLHSDKWQALFDLYQIQLRWRNEEHMFEVDGKEKAGAIQGVDASGKLVVLLTDGLRTFGLKEIRFLH